MKSLPLWIGIGLVLFLGVSGFAEVSQNVGTTNDSTDLGYQSNWSIEGEVQSQSVSGAGSPWVGAAVFYRIIDPVQIGLRGFLPWSKTVDNSSYAIQAGARVRLVHRTYTDLFFEPEYAVNVYEFIPFESYGASIGVLNRIGSGLSVGILGGLEMANVVIDSYGLEKQNDTVVYPKLAFLANFNF